MKYLPTFILTVGIILLTYFIYSNMQLGSDRLVVSAYVTDVDALNKAAGSVFVRFHFTVNGREYSDYQAIPCGRDKADAIRGVLLGDHFVQVICEKSNPSNCKVLLSKRQYKNYDIAVPDKAKTIIDSIDNICSSIN